MRKNSVKVTAKTAKDRNLATKFLLDNFGIIIITYIHTIQILRNRFLFFVSGSKFISNGSIFHNVHIFTTHTCFMYHEGRLRMKCCLHSGGKKLTHLLTYQGYQHGIGRLHSHCWGQRSCPFREVD